jgi:hypothetical protein
LPASSCLQARAFDYGPKACGVPSSPKALNTAHENCPLVIDNGV